MLIHRDLIEASERRLKRGASGDLSQYLEALDGELGDGPLRLAPEKKKERYRLLLSELGSPEKARAALERIINGNDLDGINYLSRGLAASRPVCRIQIKAPSGAVEGFATGFLVGPGVLMTNHHVFGQASEAQHSTLDFDYELDVNGNERTSAHFGLDPDRLFHADEGLDFAVVAVNPQSHNGRALEDFSWLKLDSTPGKSDRGEYLTIIQHPAGERKQVCVRENKFVKMTDDTMWYLTDTLGGSSGSPVFNRFWQVVALHHSGVPRKDGKGNWLTKDGKIWDESMDETEVDWIANEGIRISSIAAHLQEKMGSHPMVAALWRLRPPAADIGAGNGVAAGAGGRSVWVEQTGNTTSLVVPLHIPIEVIRREAVRQEAGAARPESGSLPAASPLLRSSLPVEAVKIDQTTLGTRPGYKANFLGKGKLSVPLPKIPASLRDSVATLIGQAGKTELKYFNYSVVFNKDRKLAFFSAVNIDGGLFQAVGKREGDRWFTDPRIAADIQLGEEFYGRQKTFEAGRKENPFDRGHLVRRLDATWGADVAEAKQHGDDTFHFTNCVPQFWSFNQGSRLWLGLEEFVLDPLREKDLRACVLNGPVFDGPETPAEGLPDAGAPARPDPRFGGVAIPKYFWKLLVMVKDSRLSASAFLLSQQKQILGIDRIHEAAVFERLSQAEAEVFQISIRDLQRLTGLNFGKLAEADAKEAVGRGPRRIRSLADIRR